jgi:hypothetical protein
MRFETWPVIRQELPIMGGVSANSGVIEVRSE